MKILFSLLFLCFASIQVIAQATVSKQFNLDDGIALEGYDPVSYFLSDKPQKGSASITVSQDGITYLFANQENKDKFVGDPEHYTPQYGGWCAYAMGYDGSKVKIDPKTFKIQDGKLYLFYNFYLNNTLKKWNKDETNLKQDADKNWATLVANQ